MSLLLFAIIFSFLLVQNNFNAKWGIIDDHEIAYFLGSDRKISLSEFPHIILNTEVGDFGKSLRFRPAYYIIKVTEASIWKDNPQLWYFARYMILTLFIFLMSYIISIFFGVVPSIIFTLFVMTGVYWSDIWTRLGPAEIYMALGISIYSLGLIKIIEAKAEYLFPWPLFFLGGLIAIGSKENMIILAIPSLYLLMYKIIYRKLNWKLFFPLLHILFAILISISIYLATSRANYGFYGSKITAGGSLALVIPGIEKTIKDFKIVEIVLISIFALVSKVVVLKKINLAMFLSSHKNAIFLSIFLCLTYFIQYIFYSGAWPTNIRYNFPGVLARQLFWLVSLYLLSKLFLFFDSRRSKLILIMLNILFFGSLIVSTIHAGYNTLIDSSKDNALATSMFTKNLTILSNVAKTHPDYPVVLKSESPSDYEPVISMERFIRFMGVTNVIYLNYNDQGFAKRDSLGKQLSEELTRISKSGMSENTTPFSPFNITGVSTNCIVVPLSGVEDDNECVIKVKIN